ncbi:peptidoglycan D,D-transpeptidase FtsI family protein [Halomonas huangheensis]|uniref:Peptidoglycan D,D-transpeptidase FtsI n=1 Tax=Halomonas huangheensis TaxID=1178482 RepID=W1N5A0_9GAMM|nr:penicillin-binding transpeptidase domain-containing protein [Halomonas huangheensis]ALM52139.1 cell division protein [Halomonas huangheensis]ERL50703.1 cell division protein [Halomonas huangheensis]
MSREQTRGGVTPRRPPPMDPMGKVRYVVMLLLVLIAMGLLAGRIVDLHVIDRNFLQVQGNARILRTDPIPAHRGMITDRHGDPLAVSTPVVTVWANPQDLPEDDVQLVLLAQALGQDLGQLKSRIEKYSDHEFMYLRRRMTPEAAQEILDLRVPGVHAREEYKRYYPAGEVVAQLLGVTNVDDQGQEGLELAYQSWLAGQPGKRRVIKDRRGRLVRDLEVVQEAQPGGDLVLSIDQRLQYIAYRELKVAVDENDADGGTVVMMDARTGEVLAMANQPSYNPNNRAGLDPAGLRNQAMVDVFEPGSVIKPLAMSALLETGRFPPGTVVDTSPGWMRIDSYTIRDVSNNGQLTLAGILRKSSNIGMAKLTLQLDEPLVPQRYRELGFGQAPGTGFPGEAVGEVPSPQVWSSSQWAALSYGYGLSVSALQLASAYTAIANHGERMPTSLLRLNQPPQGQQVIRPDVADRVLAMMDEVVEPGTGARRAEVPGYTVAGKTGTVRKIGDAGYAQNAYRGLFVGITPVSDPRIITVVMIDHPRGDAYYGGAIAAPVFSRIAGSALRILDVPPDQPAGDEGH